MSHVTDVILSIGWEEEGEGINEDEYPAVNVVNEWLDSKGYGKLKRVDQHGGGRKAAQVPVFMGAFNYLNILEFAKVVWAAPWAYRRQVQLFVQDEERFRELLPRILPPLHSLPDAAIG